MRRLRQKGHELKAHMVRACLNKPNKVYSFTELKETQTLSSAGSAEEMESRIV